MTKFAPLNAASFWRQQSAYNTYIIDDDDKDEDDNNNNNNNAIFHMEKNLK